MKSLLYGLPVFACLTMGCGDAEPPVVNLTTIEGDVILTQVADLSDEEIARLPQEILPAVEQGGWQRSELGLERSKVLTPGLITATHSHGLEIRVNGVPIDWAEDGSFIARDVPVTETGELNVDLVIYDKARTASFIKADVDQSRGNTDIRIRWYKLQQPAHDEHAEHEHLGTASSELHTAGFACRDYNGPFGDCKNYHDGLWKYTNFILSDCDYAWGTYGVCWLDMLGDEGADRYCNANRNCSALIGHSHSHHCH